MKMLNPSPKKIEEILDGQTKYSIPKYQRDFKWGEIEAQELIEDIDAYKNDNQEHLFLGNFIFESNTTQFTNVVDGQQRITTIMLLLIACRNHSQKLGNANLCAAIQAKITFIDSATAQSLGCRFIASESVRDLFEYMANPKWEGDFPNKINDRPVKRQVNKLRAIYEFFYNHISTFNQDTLSKFLRAVYNSYVIQINVESDEEALNIFERTNGRGLELEAADLLKNFLFSKQIPSIDEKWKEIIVNSDGTIIRMLKYFYISHYGYISKPQLYRKLKEFASKDEIGPEKFSNELIDFSRFYSLTKDPNETRTREYFENIGLVSISKYEDRYKSIAASLLALKVFGVTQFCPIAYSFIKMVQRIPGGISDNQYAKGLMKLFTCFEKYHFVNNVICERVGNEVEHLYADTCQSLKTSEKFQDSLDKLIKALREKLAKWDEFKAIFTDISYNLDQLWKIYYIFDRIVNVGLDPAQRIVIFNPDPRVIRKSNNIEHFLPQSSKEKTSVDIKTRESIDNIGNLLPLYFKTNSKLGDISPEEKILKLNGEWKNQIQNNAFVQEFVEKYGGKAKGWDFKSIEDRANNLAETAYQKAWSF